MALFALALVVVVLLPPLAIIAEAVEADMSHSFDMSHHLEDNVMSVAPLEYANDGARMDDKKSYTMPPLSLLDCDPDAHPVCYDDNKKVDSISSTNI